MRRGRTGLGLRAAALVLAAVGLAVVGCTGVAARDAAPAPYSIVALPDTQYYSASHPDIFLAQTRWIVANRAALDICFVTHEGDIVDDSKDARQWTAAVKAMDVLDGQVPYATCPGNHDEGGRTPYAEYAARFGPARFAGRPWYLGASADGANSAQKFEAGGRTFLAISLQYEAPPAAVAYAREVLKANPGLPTILTTHAFLLADGSRGVGGSKNADAAERAWTDLVAESPQIFLVLCGHNVPGVSRRVDMNKTGLPVVQIMANYQAEENGGNGFLRLMTFDEKAGRLSIRTYSPTLDLYRTDAANQFDIDLDLAARFAAGWMHADAVRAP